jgi:pyruvate formate lyase activating enzyme
MLYEKLPGAKVKCNLCPHRCEISDGKKGICLIRQNIGGELYTLNYGKLVAQHVDPIEKKPLFHFYPGSSTFSIASAGCNLHCKYCQNYEFSQMPLHHHRIMGRDFIPDITLQQAIRHGCISISYTYTEPTIFFEYAYDVARLAHSKNIKNGFITNGFITPEALRTIAPNLDAVNVDLKSFSGNFYKNVCKAKLQPVLDTLTLLNQLGIWTEVTTLVIPGLNDSEQEVYAIAEFIISISREIPWHVSAFHPAYKVTHLPPTPIVVLNRVREIGLKTGLQYVYLSNVATLHGTADTICPDCGQKLIERTNFGIVKNEIRDGYCPNCGRVIAGEGLSYDKKRNAC